MKCFYCGLETKTIYTRLGRACERHYAQIRMFGSPKRTKFDKNEISISGDVCCMKLYDAHGDVIGKTKFNIDILNKVKPYKWQLRGDGYVSRRNGNSTMRLHHIVLPLQRGLVIDHIDRDRLNNLRKNLRLVPQSKNCHNRIDSGVSYDKKRKKWIAQIMVNYKTLHLGRFKEKKDALIARSIGKNKYHGNI